MPRKQVSKSSAGRIMTDCLDCGHTTANGWDPLDGCPFCGIHDRDALNAKRDNRLAAEYGCTIAPRVRDNCRQCGYDRAYNRTCAWCGATGRQRVNEVK